MCSESHQSEKKLEIDRLSSVSDADGKSLTRGTAPHTSRRDARAVGVPRRTHARAPLFARGFLGARRPTRAGQRRRPFPRHGSAVMDLTEDELKPLYKWIDQIPLSRPKRNIARDFSDGVLVAEVIAHFYPKLVELHNYSGANAMSPKVYNWQTLNARALKKLGFQIPREDFMDVCNCRAGAIERVLKLCKIKMAEFQATHGVAGKGTATAASRSAAGGPAAPAAAAESPGARGGPSGDAAFGGDDAAPRVVLCEQCGHVNHVGVSGSGDGLPLAADGTSVRPSSGILKATSVDLGGGDADENARAEDPATRRKDLLVAELRETNSILDAKSRKLEQLVRLKDAKIQTLLNKLQALGALRPE